MCSILFGERTTACPGWIATQGKWSDRWSEVVSVSFRCTCMLWNNGCKREVRIATFGNWESPDIRWVRTWHSMRTQSNQSSVENGANCVRCVYETSWASQNIWAALQHNIWASELIGFTAVNGSPKPLMMFWFTLSKGLSANSMFHESCSGLLCHTVNWVTLKMLLSSWIKN